MARVDGERSRVSRQYAQSAVDAGRVDSLLEYTNRLLYLLSGDGIPERTPTRGCAVKAAPAEAVARG